MTSDRRKRHGGKRADDQLTRRRPGTGRQHAMTARFDDTELAALQAAADLAGLTLSAYIRTAAVEAAKTLTDQAAPETAAA